METRTATPHTAWACLHRRRLTDFNVPAKLPDNDNYCGDDQQHQKKAEQKRSSDRPLCHLVGPRCLVAKAVRMFRFISSNPPCPSNAS